MKPITYRTKDGETLSVSYAPTSVIAKYPEIAQDILIHIGRIHPHKIWISDETSVEDLGTVDVLHQNLLEYFGIGLPDDYRQCYMVRFIPLIIEHLKQNNKRKIKPLTKYQFEHTAEYLRGDGDITLNNKEHFLKIIKKDPWALEFASGAFRNDIDIVREAVNLSGATLKFASPELRNNREIVSLAVSRNGWTPCEDGLPEIILALQFASMSLKNDRDIVMQAVQKRGDALQFASDNLKNDRNIVLAAVKNMGWALEYASDDMKNDIEVVQEAAGRHGNAMQFASDALKSNKEVLLEIIKVNKSHLNGGAEAVSFCPDHLKNDRDILLEIARAGGTIDFGSLSDDYKKDREFILHASRYSSLAMDFADEALQKDRDFVLEVTTQSDQLFYCAHTYFLDDKDIMFQVIRLSSRYMKKVPESLRLDREFVLKAVKANPHSFRYVANLYEQDREIALHAVKGFGSSLELVDKSLQEDREIVLEAVKNSGNALQFASEMLKKDREIILEALKNDADAVEFVDKSALKNAAFVAEILIKCGWEMMHGRKFELGILVPGDDRELSENWEKLLYIFFRKSYRWVETTLTSDKLRDNKEHILFLMHMFWTIELTSEVLKNDRNFILKCARIRGDVLKYASDALKNDKEIVRAATRKYPSSIEYASESIKSDGSFIMDNIKRSKGRTTEYEWDMLRYLPVHVQERMVDAIRKASLG